MIGHIQCSSARLMPRKEDREILVDSPTSSNRQKISEVSSIPENVSADDLKPNGGLTSRLFGDLSSTSSQLRFIYISIGACLAAISFALLLTIFFGPPQVNLDIRLIFS